MNTNYIEIIPKIIPVFILLGVGYFLKIKKFISNNSIGEIKKLIVNISLPALLFISFLDVNFTIEFFFVILIVFFINLLMLLIGKGFAFFTKLKDPHLPLLFTGFEVGMLGIPLFGAIYGTESIKYMAVVDLGQEIYVWFVLFAMLLSLQQKEKQMHFVGLFKSFITSPIIIAILLGIILNSSGIKSLINENFLFQGVINSIDMLGSLTVPLILLVIGYEINFKTSNISLPLKIIGIRLLILVPIALLVGDFVFSKSLELEPLYNVALLSVVILPPPFIIPLFFNQEDEQGGEKSYVYNTLSISTVISIIAFLITAVFFTPTL